MHDQNKPEADPPLQDQIHDASGTVRILMLAIQEVEAMVREGEQTNQAPCSLFLEFHYPFFNREVQAILQERLPTPALPGLTERTHAVDAYFWAEQYALISYGDDPFKTTVRMGEFADFYLTHDLRWFARLLAAIGEAIEEVLHLEQAGGSLEARLQAWRNERQQWQGLDHRAGRSVWLEGTQFIKRANKSHLKKIRNTLCATASRTNRERRAIFTQWAPAWKAEIELLQQLLSIAQADLNREAGNY